MYLVELDPLTGFVKVDGEFDGVRSIRDFRNIINSEELGIECFTAIALTVDYLTPIRYYKDTDRPYKAMEIVTNGNRRAFVWEQELIQKCLITYNKLQYNPTIEEKRTLDSMLLEKLKEINKVKEDTKSYISIAPATKSNIEDLIEEYQEIKRLVPSEVSFEKLTKKELNSLIRKANLYVIIPRNEKQLERKREKDEERMTLLFKQLGTIKDLISNFNKQNDSDDIFSDGPIRNGYKLTRLEEKVEDKNSFYYK